MRFLLCQNIYVGGTPAPREVQQVQNSEDTSTNDRAKLIKDILDNFCGSNGLSELTIRNISSRQALEIEIRDYIPEGVTLTKEELDELVQKIRPDFTSPSASSPRPGAAGAGGRAGADHRTLSGGHTTNSGSLQYQTALSKIIGNRDIDREMRRKLSEFADAKNGAEIIRILEQKRTSSTDPILRILIEEAINDVSNGNYTWQLPAADNSAPGNRQPWTALGKIIVDTNIDRNTRGRLMELAERKDATEIIRILRQKQASSTNPDLRDLIEEAIRDVLGGIFKFKRYGDSVPALETIRSQLLIIDTPESRQYERDLYSYIEQKDIEGIQRVLHDLRNYEKINPYLIDVALAEPYPPRPALETIRIRLTGMGTSHSQGLENELYKLIEMRDIEGIRVKLNALKNDGKIITPELRDLIDSALSESYPSIYSQPALRIIESKLSERDKNRLYEFYRNRDVEGMKKFLEGLLSVRRYRGVISQELINRAIDTTGGFIGIHFDYTPLRRTVITEIDNVLGDFFRSLRPEDMELLGGFSSVEQYIGFLSEDMQYLEYKERMAILNSYADRIRDFEVIWRNSYLEPERRINGYSRVSYFQQITQAHIHNQIGRGRIARLFEICINSNDPKLINDLYEDYMSTWVTSNINKYKGLTREELYGNIQAMAGNMKNEEADNLILAIMTLAIEKGITDKNELRNLYCSGVSLAYALVQGIDSGVAGEMNTIGVLLSSPKGIDIFMDILMDPNTFKAIGEKGGRDNLSVKVITDIIFEAFCDPNNNLELLRTAYREIPMLQGFQGLFNYYCQRFEGKKFPLEIMKIFAGLASGKEPIPEEKVLIDMIHKAYPHDNAEEIEARVEEAFDEANGILGAAFSIDLSQIVHIDVPGMSMPGLNGGLNLNQGAMSFAMSFTCYLYVSQVSTNIIQSAENFGSGSTPAGVRLAAALQEKAKAAEYTLAVLNDPSILNNASGIIHSTPVQPSAPAAVGPVKELKDIIPNPQITSKIPATIPAPVAEHLNKMSEALARGDQMTALKEARMAMEELDNHITGRRKELDEKIRLQNIEGWEEFTNYIDTIRAQYNEVIDSMKEMLSDPDVKIEGLDTERMIGYLEQDMRLFMALTLNSLKQYEALCAYMESAEKLYEDDEQALAAVQAKQYEWFSKQLEETRKTYESMSPITYIDKDITCAEVIAKYLIQQDIISNVPEVIKEDVAILLPFLRLKEAEYEAEKNKERYETAKRSFQTTAMMSILGLISLAQKLDLERQRAAGFYVDIKGEGYEDVNENSRKPWAKILQTTLQEIYADLEDSDREMIDTLLSAPLDEASAEQLIWLTVVSEDMLARQNETLQDKLKNIDVDSLSVDNITLLAIQYEKLPRELQEKIEKKLADIVGSMSLGALKVLLYQLPAELKSIVDAAITKKTAEEIIDQLENREQVNPGANKPELSLVSVEKNE